jgi:hypothetical protein
MPRGIHMLGRKLSNKTKNKIRKSLLLQWKKGLRSCKGQVIGFIHSDERKRISGMLNKN